MQECQVQKSQQFSRHKTFGSSGKIEIPLRPQKQNEFGNRREHVPVPYPKLNNFGLRHVSGISRKVRGGIKRRMRGEKNFYLPAPNICRDRGQPASSASRTNPNDLAGVAIKKIEAAAQKSVLRRCLRPLAPFCPSFLLPRPLRSFDRIRRLLRLVLARACVGILERFNSPGS